MAEDERTDRPNPEEGRPSRTGVWRYRCLTWLIALGLVALVFGYRAAIGVPIKPSLSADGRFARSGILVNPLDYLTYITWAQQARSGRLWCRSLYTTVPHPAVYFNPFFASLGFLSSVSGVDLFFLYHLVGLLAGFLAIVLLFEAVRRIGLTPAGATWSCAFAAFSTGLTGVLSLAPTTWMPESLALGADRSYCDTLPLTAYICSPYHTVALFNLVLVLYSVTLAEGASGRRTGVVTLVLVTATVAWTMMVRPYEFPLLGAAYLVFAVLSLRLTPGALAARRFAVLLAMGAGAGPVVIYDLYLTTLPVWHNYSRLTAYLPFPRLSWLSGYGVVLALGLVGAGFVLKQFRRCTPALWVVLWAGAGLFCLVVAAIPYTKVSGGIYYALCILAGLAVDRWISAIWKGNRRFVRLAGGAALVGVLVLAFVPGGFLLRSFTVSPTYELHPVAVVDVMDRAGVVWGPESTVLCDPATCGFLPALFGISTYCGHWSLTPGYYERRAAMIMAGLALRPRSPERFPAIEQMALWLARVLTDARCQYILIRRSWPICKELDQSRRFQVQSRNNSWTLYRDLTYKP